jgi:hypothetical protein
MIAGEKRFPWYEYSLPHKVTFASELNLYRVYSASKSSKYTLLRLGVPKKSGLEGENPRRTRHN